MVSFSSHYLKLKEIFLQYLLWEPDQIPGGISQNIVEASLLLGTPRVFNSLSCPPCLQQFINYSSGFPILALVSVVVPFCEFLLVNCDSLYSSVCLSNLGGSSLPCVLLSITYPKRVVDFCSAFHLLVQSGDFQAPFMGTRDP